MAAVLEAMPIKLAECETATPTEPLAPLYCYSLLRSLGDDGPSMPSGGSQVAAHAVGLWIERGETLSGLVPEQSGPPDGTPDQRRAALRAHLTRLVEFFESEYLPVDGSTTVEPGRFSRIQSVEEALATPRVHELAADAREAVRYLLTLVEPGPTTKKPVVDV
jgi:hypothetical protein